MTNGQTNNNQDNNKVTGMWHGTLVKIKKTWGSHTFTDDELTKLFNGQLIEIDMISKTGSPYKVIGELAEQEYEGHKCIGFKRIQDDIERFTGEWQGKSVTVKRTWSTHTFTDEEIEKLLNNEVITFETKSKNTDSMYTVKGKLAELDYDGNVYIGFKRIMDED